MEATQLLGLAAGICTSAASVPQIITTIKTKKATDVSPVMFIVLLTGNSLWVWYGVVKSDLPIIATNIISVVLDLTMLFLRFKYREKSNGDTASNLYKFKHGKQRIKQRTGAKPSTNSG